MKKRKNSFFGLHFDFHANPINNVTIGSTLKEEDIREICRAIRPDYIQIDCKGHPGWTSYPSKLGNAMPSFEGDPLALWRKVTKEEDVALYMHYSGIYDIKYCSEHPDSSSMDATGKTRLGFNRHYDSYADELLIPQISELAENYHIDGVWIDGDCWAVVPDFREDSLKAFEKAKGISLNGSRPATPSDPYYYEYREYYKELFRSYVRRYVDALHEKHPELQIASNWSYTDHMPEKVSSNVDFISGDLNPINSFNSARYAARAIAHQQHPWDLMAWNFRFNLPCGYPDKHPVQILQEAASVISLGGGFQNYIMQRADGSPNMASIRRMSVLSDFMREREPFCFKGVPVHQAVLLLSTFDRAHEVVPRVYSREGYEKQMGLTALLCDAGQSLEMVFEHDLSGNCEKYPMIVIPELKYGLEETMKKELIDYAYNGGSLMLVGKHTCSLFADAGLPFTTSALKQYKSDDIDEKENGHTSMGRSDFEIYMLSLRDGDCLGGLVLPCELHADNSAVIADAISNDRAYPAAITFSYGKGKICAIGFDIGSQYLTYGQYLYRNLIKKATADMYEPKAKVESVVGTLEIVCLEKDDKIYLQLVNANGNHSNPNYVVEDHIPPVIDARISVKTSNPNAQVVLQPCNKKLECEYRDGRLYFTVDRIDIHSVAEITESN